MLYRPVAPQPKATARKLIDRLITIIGVSAVLALGFLGASGVLGHKAGHEDPRVADATNP